MAHPEYPELVDGHEVHVDHDGTFVVVCPLPGMSEPGAPDAVSRWSKDCEAWEVVCPLCEWAEGRYPLHPDHGPHDALTDPDEPPPIGGGAGGNHVSDWAPCEVPLRRVRAFEVVLTVHEGVTAAIARVDAGYRAANGAARYPVRQSVTAAYNCRRTTSGTSMSKHSWGVAVDVNWDKNPYGKKLITDMPRWFIDLWKAEGFGWGGDWNSVKDAMHYSKFPNEGGDGRLYVGSAPRPEPVITTIQEDEVETLHAGNPRTTIHRQSGERGFSLSSDQLGNEARTKIRVAKGRFGFWPFIEVVELEPGTPRVFLWGDGEECAPLVFVEGTHATVRVVR